MENSDPDISEKTFANVLMSMIELAKRDKDKLLVLMVRPHPRAVRSKELWDAVASSKLPSNLSVVSAARNICKDINEAAYAADVIVSILSTENFKAPLRGRTSAFLGFSESGMGKDALERMYSPEILSAVREMSGLAIVSSKDELVRWLIQQKRAEVPSKQNEKQKSASEQIIEIAFAD